jgi:hypothetical protein
MRTPLTLLSLFVLATPSMATLLVYEGFDYADGNLNTLNGGIGFSNAWGPAVNPAGGVGAGIQNVESGRLRLVGNAAGGATIYRDLATEYGADGTTVWIGLSMIRTGLKDPVGGAPNGGLTSTGASYVRPLNFALFDVTSTTAQSERLSFGEGTRTSGDTDTFGLLVGGSATNAATVWSNAPVDVDNFAVVRIDFGAANVDTAWLWINPAFGSEPATGSAAATTTGNFTFDRVRPFAGNPNNQTINGVVTATLGAEGYIDNFAVGTTFADVIPEPATGMLAGLSLAGLMARRRR